MLTGMPPFYHHDRETLFANIKYARLEVPQTVPRAARSLIEETMERDPSRRLGARNTSDVKAHNFFSGLDFDELMRREVPVPDAVVLPGLSLADGRRASSPPSNPGRGRAPESPFARPRTDASGNGWRARYSRSSGQEAHDEHAETTEGVSGWEFAAVAPPSPMGRDSLGYDSFDTQRSGSGRAPNSPPPTQQQVSPRPTFSPVFRRRGTT